MITETSCVILLKLKFVANWISLWIFLLTSVLMALVRIWLWPQQCFPVLLCLEALKAIFQGKAWKAHLLKTPLRFFWKSPLNRALGNWAKLASPLLVTSWIGTFHGVPPHLDWVFSESDPGSRFCHEHIWILWTKAAKFPMCHFTCMTFLQGPRTWSSNTVMDYSHSLIRIFGSLPFASAGAEYNLQKANKSSEMNTSQIPYCCRELTQR